MDRRASTSGVRVTTDRAPQKLLLPAPMVTSDATAEFNPEQSLALPQ